MLSSTLLLFPLWYPSFEAALNYARFLGRQAGRDVTVHDLQGALVGEGRYSRSSYARAKFSLDARTASELYACNLELRQQIDSLTRLEWELLETNEREHRRFGWDLHEDLGQQLAGITFLASLLARQFESNYPDLGNDLRELVNQLREAILHTRNIARGLYPIGLENGGLLMVMEELASWTTQVERIPCDFRQEPGFQFAQQSAIHLYRIAQEGVNYLIKTGKARRITIECLSVPPAELSQSASEEPPCPALLLTGEGIEAGEQLAEGIGLIQTRARMIGAEVSSGKSSSASWYILCKLSMESSAPGISLEGAAGR